MRSACSLHVGEVLAYERVILSLGRALEVCCGLEQGLVTGESIAICCCLLAALHLFCREKMCSPSWKRCLLLGEVHVAARMLSSRQGACS